jgi:glycerophosphoryl diester phosphodiesterase
MLILSHRGSHVHAPENTLEAFKAAIALGIDGVETDIRLSADNLPILFHNRLAPDGREVSSLSRNELSSVVGYSVPTLEEALRLPLKDGREVLWNLEIKTPSALDVTLEIVGFYASSKCFLITSFLHPVIQAATQRPDASCGILVAHQPINFQFRPDWIPSQVSTIVWNYEILNPSLVERSAAFGLRNFVYGALTHREHEILASWEIDGIITDYPEYCSIAIPNWY